MASRSRASEVFDACVALQIGGELEARYPTRRVHARELEGRFVLIVDGAVCGEGSVFDVANMFVTARRAFRNQASPQPAVRSNMRLRALADVAPAPAAVVPAEKR